MLKRVIAIALFLLVPVGVAAMVLGTAQQQKPPDIPKGHVSIRVGAPVDLCFRCHKTPPALDKERFSFCATCHINTHLEETEFVDVARVGNRSKHPVEFDWAAADCSSCHTEPHKTKPAPHPVTAQQPLSAFCQPCHLNPADPQKAVGGKEKAGEFCASCHHIGLNPNHVKAPQGVKVNFCFGCHKPAP